MHSRDLRPKAADEQGLCRHALPDLQRPVLDRLPRAEIAGDEGAPLAHRARPEDVLLHIRVVRQ
jgi:hypothetical protein